MEKTHLLYLDGHRISDCQRYTFVEAANELIASSMVAASRHLGEFVQNGVCLGQGDGSRN